MIDLIVYICSHEPSAVLDRRIRSHATNLLAYEGRVRNSLEYWSCSFKVTLICRCWLYWLNMYTAVLSKTHGLAGSANTALLSIPQRHRGARGISHTKLPRARSISRRNGLVPIGNDAISPRGAMTKMWLEFVDPGNPCKTLTTVVEAVFGWSQRLYTKL
jgi:hypothetical protein